MLFVDTEKYGRAVHIYATCLRNIAWQTKCSTTWRKEFFPVSEATMHRISMAGEVKSGNAAGTAPNISWD